MKFYSYYNRPPQVVTELDYETKFVSQAEADTCSLDYQLHRFGMDGLQARMEAMRDKFGYADCTVSNSFMELQNRVREATEYFEALPSEIRRKFEDKPENFYEFIDKNKEQAVKEGYIPPIEDVSIRETSSTPVTPVVDTQTDTKQTDTSSSSEDT